MRARASALLILVLGLLLSPVAPPAHAADNGKWSVFPATGEDVQGRAHFRLEAAPGSTVRDEVTVANLSGSARTFHLYGADAYNTPRDGGFAVRGAEEEHRGVGVWLRLDREKLRIPAGGRTTVPFTLTVPTNAEPGDHPGAVIALDQEVRKAGGAVGVGVRQAVGARVYLQVTGERKPAVEVEDVRWEYEAPAVPGTGDDPATIRYTLVNSGNVTLRPEVRLAAEGVFGRELVERAAGAVPLELLPGERVRLFESWTKPPAMDRGDVTVTVTDEATGQRASASTSFLVVPWLLLAAVVLLLTVLALLLLRRRRGAADAAPRE
ncbi:DUF916 domain-containing protein [Streptomyces sp. TRM 70351]|uniref:COG1470 family protein n=1 Tax=Streptomyces sp. TRM 70351 TaxID=3116552 RepID=UPI002E7BDE2A|nr:DUF916 domain-containing protein [Streptomyces sp. TRM 70351]MEE1927488.1 DUF916 domain-containing protein [Streptomyces sp. TRM 70351]